MTTPFGSALSAVQESIAALAGVSVVYSQGATTVTATAIPGRSDTDLETAEGVIRTDRSNDFIFKASDLGLVPQRGDTISWGSRLFAVTTPASGRHYEYSDPAQTVIRVHTKQINAS